MKDRYSKRRRERVEAAVRAILAGYPDDSCVVVIRTHDGYFTAGGNVRGEGLGGVARLARLGADHIRDEVAAGHDGSEAANVAADAASPDLALAARLLAATRRLDEMGWVRVSKDEHTPPWSGGAGNDPGDKPRHVSAPDSASLLIALAGGAK